MIKYKLVFKSYHLKIITGDWMEKLLDVENVSISFIQYTQGLNQRDLKVITDLTLDISEGEILESYLKTQT